jgi:hypothetical protein
VCNAKDPVAVKFGKDIAGLIHLHVWKLMMNDMNSDYVKNVTSRLSSVIINSNTYNWRTSQMFRLNVYSTVHRTDNGEPVAKLPKNYCL